MFNERDAEAIGCLIWIAILVILGIGFILGKTIAWPRG